MGEPELLVAQLVCSYLMTLSLCVAVGCEGYSDCFEGFVWYAMEFCLVGSLFSLLCRLAAPLLPLPMPVPQVEAAALPPGVAKQAATATAASATFAAAARCWKIVRSVVKGVSFLHSRNVVHRDLKLENVLITSTTVDGITTEHVSEGRLDDCCGWGRTHYGA